MENKVTLLVLALVLSFVTVQVRFEYHFESKHGFHLKEKVTHLHFYLFDILCGDKPTAFEVARPNTTVGSKSSTPFGHVYAIDDVLREGPDASSKVIGNAQGLYMSSSLDDNLTLVMYVDFGFTTGKFNGSSISVFSRNPVTDPRDRELAVVGGRGKFRMARGSLWLGPIPPIPQMVLPFLSTRSLLFIIRLNEMMNKINLVGL